MDSVSDVGLADSAGGSLSREEAFEFASRYLEGQRYVDLNCGHGAALVGHSHPVIQAALRQGLEMGILCGQETVLPGRVAKHLVEMVPCAESVRLMFTGTEATALAVRVARAFTGRLKVVKFEGHYHGHNDVLQFNLSTPLGEAGPRENPPIRDESAGTLPEVGDYVSVLPWNDLDLLESLLEREADRTAAVIMEPINLNLGGILSRPGYLEGVRELTRRHGVVLIFDEILSGFRTGPSCAQGYLGVTPDLTTLGKAIGGGLPISALVGRKEVMEMLAPVGEVINQGTYYGQVLVMHAAEAFLELAADPAPWAHQETLERRLYQGLEDLFGRTKAGCVQAVGNRFGFYFGPTDPITEWRDLEKVDQASHSRFYRNALRHGVYLMSSWHHGFSWAHSEKDIDEALDGLEGALRDTLTGEDGS